MTKCRNPDCNNKAQKEGWLCKSCYTKEEEKEQAGVYDVLLETSKRSKKEHQVLIAYIAGVVAVLLAYGGFIDNANTASVWYGISFTVGLILALSLPALLIWFQLSNERKIIQLEEGNKQIRKQ